MINFIKNQIDEIKETPGLNIFGAFLAVSHFYAIALWNKNQFLISKLSLSNSEPICFPFFPNCDIFFDFSETFIQYFLYLYLSLAIIGLFCFLQKRLVTTAYYILATLFVFHTMIHFSNYSFMGNYNYIASLIYLTYLFIPQKKIIIKYLIVGIYLTAGILKINMDWLSGATAPYPLTTWGSFLIPVLFYVVILEVVFIFGLLCSSRSIRLFSLTQLIGFHLLSLQVIGMFHPMMMLSFLSIFIIDEYYYSKNILKPKDHINRFFTLNEKSLVYVFLSIFILMQIFPYLITKDPSLSGSIRLSSLNKFHPRPRCKVLIVAHRKKQNQIVHLTSSMKKRGARLKCDPTVYLNEINQLCRKNIKSNDFDAISFSIVSRNSSEKDYKPILFLKDACSQKKLLWSEYSLLGGI